MPAPNPAVAGAISAMGIGGLNSLMMEIGRKTGLLQALGKGSQTVSDVATSSGVHERYAKEWMSAMASAGVLDYDADTKKFCFKEGFAELLSGEKENFFTVMCQWTSLFATNIDRYVDVFKNGGGVGYEHFARFQSLMSAVFRTNYDNDLIKTYLPNAKSINTRLHAGESLQVLDVGCGSGHAINVLAKAFPKSEFTGFDFSQEAVDNGATEASQMGLTNARFVLRDIGDGRSEWGGYDLVTAFDSIHDQAKPQQVLNNVYTCLKPGGCFLMQDINMESELEKNIGHPMSSLLYSISTMHCMTVSMAQGGDALGTCWGTGQAKQMLNTAGFTEVELYPAADGLNVIYIAQK